MRKLGILLVMFALGTFMSQAQDVIGNWKTFDDETGEAKSIVQIYEQGGKMYGKVVEILNPAKRDAKCQNCKGSDKDKPILGLVIIKGLSKDGNEWNGGQILDPNKGKLYKCSMSLEGKDVLKVRGYVGISLLGRTQTWKKVK